MLAPLIAAISVAPVMPMSIVSASMFKNGYAVIVREGTLPAGGSATIEEVPSAVLGTFWLTASSGVVVDSATMTNQTTTEDAAAQTLDEILGANVGKRLALQLGDKTEIVGTLESAAGTILVVREDEGMRVLAKSAVAQVRSVGGELVWKVPRSSAKPVLDLRYKNVGSAGKFYMVSLERGLTWTPAYSIDITDPKKLKLISKATILDDTGDLKNIEVRLITGFPNVPFISFWDPFSSHQSVDQFVGGMMQMGTPDQMRAGAGRGMMMNQAPAAPGNFDEAFPQSNLPGISAEDLFFYRLPGVSLKKGDRGYYVLFSSTSDYSHVYEWSIPDRIVNDRYNQNDAPADVWHSLSFKNNAGQPLTTGTATIFKGGEILGQDMLRYTSAGSDALVKMTKALDIHAEDAEEETGRTVVEQPIHSNYYDVVTLKGTLSIQNLKSEDVSLKITKELTGEMIAADGTPKITTITKGLRAVNPRQSLEWKINLKPDERRILTYSYRVHIIR